ncbi:MAG TPA: hypothetical protein DD426_02690 [Clostridiaceae bacterium]|nr:hypothetical protein [Clostridiaceae bacterium]
MKKVFLILLAFCILFVPGKYVFAEDVQKEELQNGKTHINYPIDAATQKLIDEKQKLEDLYFKAKEGKISVDILHSAEQNFDKAHNTKLSDKDYSIISTKSNSQKTNNVSPQTNYSNFIFDLYQEPQQKSYYCGPATACMIIKAKSISITQSQAAASLGTEIDKETPWYRSASVGYPMANTLNSYESTSWYIPYGTNVEAATFLDHVVFDIDHDYGVAGDANEVKGGPHLNGHPDQNIFHWFAIDGYTDNMANVHYADPVSGASSISWSGNVPQYSKIYYQTLATIVDGRGIIW